MMSFHMGKKQVIWVIWIGSTLVVLVYLGYRLFGEDKTLYLVGISSDGHHQIEEKCELCHSEPFGGGEVLQEACTSCHGEELKLADDSHPKSKFTDPRNASLVKILDARYCATCHVEHQRERTRAMGVTLPDDYCFRCHQDVGTDRPSHKDLAFKDCSNAGCHNFHDNEALYEDFLVKHAGGADTIKAALPSRNLAVFFSKTADSFGKRLVASDADGPERLHHDSIIVDQWTGSAHARGGVNCTDCHQPESSAWKDNPDTQPCGTCHESEKKGFQAGKHGMRVAAGLSPMTPSQARLPMQPDAHDKQLSCGSCHNPHSVDVKAASVESCLQCHNDDHSRAYKTSPHAAMIGAAGKGPYEEAVTCATCHLPRLVVTEKGIERILVQHNQNDNLRPNEKMIRQVCLQCHSLQFSLDSLADTQLIRTNFSMRPGKHIPSIEWAMNRVKEKKEAN